LLEGRERLQDKYGDSGFAGMAAGTKMKTAVMKMAAGTK
jgi:hypothetical protein